MTTEFDSLAESIKDQVTKMMERFKLPEVDVQALVESQRKDIEAMSKAAQLSADGAAAVSQRQLEIFQATSEHVSAMLRDMKLSNQQQGDLAKKAFESALAGTRELAEITAKSNEEVFGVVKQRMVENFERMRSVFQAGQNKA